MSKWVELSIPWWEVNSYIQQEDSSVLTTASMGAQWNHFLRFGDGADLMIFSVEQSTTKMEALTKGDLQ